MEIAYDILYGFSSQWEWVRSGRLKLKVVLPFCLERLFSQFIAACLFWFSEISKPYKYKMIYFYVIGFEIPENQETGCNDCEKSSLNKKVKLPLTTTSWSLTTLIVKLKAISYDLHIHMLISMLKFTLGCGKCPDSQVSLMISSKDSKDLRLKSE